MNDDNQPMKSGTNSVDTHVGQRVRLGRELCGVSAEKLAGLLMIDEAELTKFELGILRFSSGQLFKITQTLNLPVSWFFEGLGGSSSPAADHRSVTAEIAHLFDEIHDEHHRSRLMSKIKKMIKCDKSAS